MSYQHGYQQPPPNPKQSLLNPQNMPPPSTAQSYQQWPPNFQMQYPPFNCNVPPPFQQQPQQQAPQPPFYAPPSTFQMPPPQPPPIPQPQFAYNNPNVQQMPPQPWHSAPPTEHWATSRQDVKPPADLNMACVKPEPETKGDPLPSDLPKWLRAKVQTYDAEKRAKEAETRPAQTSAVSPTDTLREAVLALELLKGLQSAAESSLRDESEEQWSELMHQVKVCKAKLRTYCEQLSKDDVLAELRTRSERRRKKRERLRRLRQERKEEAEDCTKRAALIEARINAQRQRILDKVNQERQEEDMKEEADSILSEIRFKINRTREYLEKIRAMEQLRAARKLSYQQKGLYVAPEADSTFETETASVRSLLEGELSNYLKEETALKVMLETEQKEQYETKKLAVRQAAVIESLFGNAVVEPPVYPCWKLYTSAAENLESFIRVR
ncbi:unnamed protein product [Ixodes hexagonus]